MFTTPFVTVCTQLSKLVLADTVVTSDVHCMRYPSSDASIEGGWRPLMESTSSAPIELLMAPPLHAEYQAVSGAQ